MIPIKDRRQIIHEYIKYDDMLKSRRADERKHIEQRERDLEHDLKTRENRTRSMAEHEQNNKENKMARAKEVEARQEFLRKSLTVL